MKYLKIIIVALFISMIPMTAFADGVQPVSRQDTGNGQIVLTYDLPADTAPESVIPATFTESGYNYTQTDISSADLCSADTINVSVGKNVQSTKKIGVSAFDKTIGYDQDGYSGTLNRDDVSFKTSVTGTKTIRKPVSEMQKITGLAKNDLSNIPKTLDGLWLTATEWFDQRTGESVKGFTQGTPGPYYAVAHYSGAKTETVATGYSAYVTYNGTAEKQTVTGKEVTVTYAGTAVASGGTQWYVAAGFVIGGILLILVGLGIAGYIKKKRSVTK